MTPLGKHQASYQAWNVSLYGRHADRVRFLKHFNAAGVYRSLVGHDGYDPNIKVRKARDQKPKPLAAKQGPITVADTLYEALRKLMRHERMLGSGCSVSADILQARQALAEYEKANK